MLFEPSGAISKTGRRSRRARRPSSFPKGPSKSQGLGYDTVVKRLRRRARTLDKATLHRIFKDIASLHIKSDAHDNADTISFSEWREVCETALQLDVRDAELQRLWARMTRDQTGVPVQERELGFEAFARGASTLTFLQQVVSASLEGPARDFKVPDDYDYSTYTNANCTILPACQRAGGRCAGTPEDGPQLTSCIGWYACVPVLPAAQTVFPTSRASSSASSRTSAPRATTATT